MLEEVPILRKTIEERLSSISDLKSLEAFDLNFSKEGKVQALFDRMKEAP